MKQLVEHHVTNVNVMTYVDESNLVSRSKIVILQIINCRREFIRANI